MNTICPTQAQQNTTALPENSEAPTLPNKSRLTRLLRLSRTLGGKTLRAKMSPAAIFAAGVIVAMAILAPGRMWAQDAGTDDSGDDAGAAAGDVPSGANAASGAAGARTMVVDDFESGVGAWTRNDQIKSDNPSADVLLVDVVATRATRGGPRASNGAALFSFKAARSSWASASTRVNGARWAKIGARSLTFWLNADGAAQGTELVLRARYPGAAQDESFSIPIALNHKSWKRVVIPLANFKNASGPLLPRLSGVYLLQFVQRGSWDSRFFTVDQIQVEGTGVPLAQRVAGTATGTVIASPTGETPDAARVSVDFLKKLGRVRTSANISVGAALPGANGAPNFPLTGNPQFQKAVKSLAPRLIRLDASTLVELVDSSRPAFDFSRLAAAVRQARKLNAEPLVSLGNDPLWGLDERGYALFAAGAARAVNAGNPRPARLFELATATAPGDDGLAVAFYNRGYATLKALNKNYRVGGIGAGSGRPGPLRLLLSRARGLDFLSLQFFGAPSGQPAETALFAAARDLQTLRVAAGALDKSRFRNAPLYVTQSNLNAARAARDDGTLIASDNRTTQSVAAAWWAAYLSSVSRLADQVFHNDAANPEWGLLSFGQEVGAYPAYYTLWMWNTFFPAGTGTKGSERVLTTVARGTSANAAGPGDVAAFAVNTPTAHNLLLANTRDVDTTVRISIRGFPVLRAAYMHVLDDRTKNVQRFVRLPKSPFQTITLRPYSVAVIQFVEPPRKR